ncbi:MAG TPA: serine hydrolase domain-containing protein [Anaerolineae bacterium]|nr:serine hydrolase domain-containing protein [Anaerolineae bacterium]HQK12750.1 serine hydrolase domain-containing protein [Anaerolineae bacterium]
MQNPTLTQPLDFSHEVPAEKVGMRKEGLAALTALFEDQITVQNLHPAAQLVVIRHGQVIVDRALGQGRRGPINATTPFLTFSISKVFTAMGIHRLIEEGRIEMDAPIATYWPEFGCKGKERATIRHALLHQAGIPAPGLRWQIFLWPFWGAVTHSVARLRAEYEPGSKTAYHLVNFGFILGEVIRRVTGMPVDRYLHRQFCAPLGLQRTWMRLPRAMLRETPRLTSDDNPFIRQAVRVFNMPIIRRSLLPAASLHSTARDLATFFQMLLNGGLYAGKRLLQADTITQATSLGYAGWDEFIQAETSWGYGFILGGKSGEFSAMGKGSSLRTFAGFGLGSCMVWADPDADLVVAFTCNGLRGEGNEQRWAALCDAVWDALT